MRLFVIVIVVAIFPFFFPYHKRISGLVFRHQYSHIHCRFYIYPASNITFTPDLSICNIVAAAVVILCSVVVA